MITRLSPTLGSFGTCGVLNIAEPLGTLGIHGNYFRDNLAMHPAKITLCRGGFHGLEFRACGFVGLASICWNW